MEDKFRDAPLEVLHEAVDSFGATRLMSNLIRIEMSPFIFDFQLSLQNVLKVVARIVLVPGSRDDKGSVHLFL